MVSDRQSRLYIANLPIDSTESQFRKFLEENGLSENQFLLTMKQGFAFVDFFEQEVADMALDKLQKTTFNGSVVAIEPTEALKSDYSLLFSGFNSKNTTNEDIKNFLGDIKFLSLEPLNSTGENSSGAFIVRFSGHTDANQIMLKFSGKTYNEMQIKVENYCPRGGDGGENEEIGAGDMGNEQPLTFRKRENEEIGAGDMGNEQPLTFRKRENEEIGAGDMRNEQPLIFRKKLTFKYNGNRSGNEMPLKLMVANDFVGAIIGRKGMTVKNITQETGARVDILPIQNNSVDKTVQIIGPAENCSAACRKIMEVLVKEADFSKSTPELALRLIAANTLIGRVIGKGGSTIKKIMSDTQTKIHVSNMTNMPDFYSERIISIRGSLDGMTSAEEQVSSKLRAAYLTESNTNIMPFKNVNNIRHDNRINFYTPSTNMNFNNSRRFSGGGGYNNNYNNYNNNENITPGEQYLNMLGLGGGSNLNDNFNSINNNGLMNNYKKSEGIYFGPMNYSQETSYMFIPHRAVGAIIGVKGNNIRKIINLSGASVKIANAPGIDENRRVTIFGPFESHLRAQELITDYLIEYERSLKEPWEMTHFETTLVIEIMVPTVQVGKLIGKSGEVIRNIQRVSKANLKFLTGENEAKASEEGKTLARITGPIHAIQCAQLQVKQMIVFGSLPSNRNNNFSKSPFSENELPSAAAKANTTSGGGGPGVGAGVGHDKDEI